MPESTLDAQAQWGTETVTAIKSLYKCRFIQSNLASSPADSLPPGSDKKRARSRDDNGEPEASDSDVGDDDKQGLEAIGYIAGPLFESLTISARKRKKPLGELTWVTPDTYPQLKTALSVLPSRRQIDTLIQSLFNNINYHYYIIYPPIFNQEYQA
ncbi:hypothetical protein BFJ71_g14941 [Fusarium oxysporum]|nr:hypothetical protein BFJ71_g14941 [Fusarium oxysporum]